MTYVYEVVNELPRRVLGVRTGARARESNTATTTEPSMHDRSSTTSRWRHHYALTNDYLNFPNLTERRNCRSAVANFRPPHRHPLLIHLLVVIVGNRDLNFLRVLPDKSPEITLSVGGFMNYVRRSRDVVSPNPTAGGYFIHGRRCSVYFCFSPLFSPFCAGYYLCFF